LVGCVLATSPALAQTRTPTSPLDTTPSTPREGEVREVEVAPTASSPAAPRAELATPRLPRAVSATSPLELDALLPDGVADAEGLDVEAAVARAARASIAARRAELGARAADAGTAVARRGFVPQARLSARYTRLSDITPGTISAFDTAACLRDLVSCQAAPDTFVQRVVLQEPILNQYALRVSVGSRLSDLIGVQRHQLRAAEHDAEAAAEQARAARDQVVVDALDAYWEVVRARAQLVLAEEAGAVAGRRAQEASERLDQGVGTEGERLAADAAARSYAQLVAVARSRAEIAEAVLRDLLRLDEGAPLRLRADLGRLPEAPTLPPAQLRRSARKRSPDVAAALSRAEAADARADALRAQLYPALGVAFNVDVANPNQRIFPQTTDFTTTWDASVELSWSFDGALVAGARMQQQRAVAEDQRLAAEELRESIERAALQARGGLLAALAGVEAQHAATASAIERARVVTERRTAGLATATDLAEAESARLGARLDLVDAVVDAHLADARLRRALGVSSNEVARVEER
jgi:outer membrane protein TolC